VHSFPPESSPQLQFRKNTPATTVVTTPQAQANAKSQDFVVSLIVPPSDELSRLKWRARIVSPLVACTK
jgi:hypothetical protein